MKKVLFGLMGGLFLFGSVVQGADFSWHHSGISDLGQDTKSWHKLYLNDDIVFEGDTEDSNETIISPVEPTRQNNVTLEDAGGSFSLVDLTSHDFNSGTATWTLSTDEIMDSVLIGTNAGGTVTISITEANAIQGKPYFIYNNTGQTLNFKTSNGTGTSITNGNHSINYINDVPDVVKIYEG